MAAGTLTEEVVEEVATNLEEVAAATRRLDTKAIGFFGLGLGVGLGVGFYFGHKWNKEKLRLEAFKESEAEVEAIRETYRRKEMVADKPRLEQIIEDSGYSEVVRNQERPLPPPVPIMETPSAFVERSRQVTSKDDGWSYPRELANRTPNAPYIIHQDEFKNSEHGYEQVTYTYWAGDDVLTDSDNQPLIDAANIIGTDNIKWGHGADDIDVVFVRNDRLELEMEICRDHRSWEESVKGLDGDSVEDALEHSHQSRPAPRQPKRRE